MLTVPALKGCNQKVLKGISDKSGVDKDTLLTSGFQIEINRLNEYRVDDLKIFSKVCGIENWRQLKLKAQLVKGLTSHVTSKQPLPNFFNSESPPNKRRKLVDEFYDTEPTTWTKDQLAVKNIDAAEFLLSLPDDQQTPYYAFSLENAVALLLHRKAKAEEEQRIAKAEEEQRIAKAEEEQRIAKAEEEQRKVCMFIMNFFKTGEELSALLELVEKGSPSDSLRKVLFQACQQNDKSSVIKVSEQLKYTPDISQSTSGSKDLVRKKRKTAVSHTTAAWGKLYEICQAMRKDHRHIELFINNTKIHKQNGNSLDELVETAPLSTLSEIKEFLVRQKLLSESQNLDEDKTVLSILHNDPSECEIQNYLVTLLKNYAFIDTSNSPSNIPYLSGLLKKKKESSETSFKPTAKPDICSLNFPMVIELKYDSATNHITNSATQLKGLAQCLERIFHLMIRLSHLSLIVGILYSNRAFSWLIIAQQRQGVECDRNWIVTTKLIPVSIIVSLCKYLNENALENPNFFEHEDAQWLVQIPKIMYNSDIPLEYFRVKWIKSSSYGRVYLITPPIIHHRKFIETPGQTEHSIAVKVVFDNEQFKEETTSFLKMKPFLDDRDWNFGEFYVLGFSGYDEQENKFKFIPISLKIPQFLEVDSSGLLRFKGSFSTKPLSDLTGGIIFMKPGVSIPSNTNQDDIRLGVTVCLDILHSAGRVHRDIRAPNVLKFDDSIQLIDYGFSGKMGENFLVP